jgi:uncharacterized protein
MKINKLRVVIDTNVLLVLFLPKHRFYWIIQSLLDDKFDLLVTNEMLTEYIEILGRKYDPFYVEFTLISLLKLPNVYRIRPRYNWSLIIADPDDNKFVDCAIAGNSDFIVTHDKHFNILKDIPFPKVETLKIDEFKDILDNWGKEAFE